MARRAGSQGPKENIGVTVDAELLAELLARCGPRKEYAHLSHAVESAIALVLGERDTRIDRLETRVRALENRLDEPK